MTTQETNPIAYARGVLQVEADTYKHQRDDLYKALERVIDAHRVGADLDQYIALAVLVLNRIGERL